MCFELLFAIMVSQARPATMREEHLLSADANGIENRRLCLLGPLLLQVRARPVRAPKGRLFTGAKGASTEKPVLNAVTCKHEYWTYIGGRQYPPPNPSFPRINGPADPLACITNMNTNRNQLCSTNSNKTWEASISTITRRAEEEFNPQ